MDFHPFLRFSGLGISCFLLPSRWYERTNEKKKPRVTFARKKQPRSANERSKVLDEGVAKVRGAITAARASCRTSAALSSVYTHGYNILMKERPDRAKCPRRLALPNCWVPRPSGGLNPSPGSEHSPSSPIVSHRYNSAGMIPHRTHSTCA